MDDSLSLRDPQRKPIVSIEDGRLYVDGVHVFKEQLTEDELKEYFPEEYNLLYSPNERPCPVCKKAIKFENTKGLNMHYRQAHPDKFKSALKIFNNPDYRKDLPGFLKALQDHAHRVTEEK